MNAPAPCLLDQITTALRPHLVNRSTPARLRLRALWAHAVAARETAAADVVAHEFVEMAQATGLTRDLGRHGSAEIAHIVSWALNGRDPFG